ncbi:MAG TPA: peptidoglycan editing factor PgeF [Armatimonadota bacterium]|nr:peptidoglycan editing factor PgeF [Armatimonadota bacterium]
MFETICEFALFPHLRHVISTRDGGVSEGNLGTLNLGYHVADDPVAVSENRRRLGHAVGYDPSTLIAAQQVHGTAISWVSHNDCGRGAFAWDTALPNTDGLIVSEANVPVTIQVADCAPVLIADPVRHVLAVVHAGWRGALGGIASAAVRQMIEHSGTTPSDLLVGIGPTLCPDCFEIGPEVAVQVRHAFGADTFARINGTAHLDIRAMIAADLATVGVGARQVVGHEACTRCQNQRFFSHRGQHGNAGRFALVAWWES